MAKHKPQQYIKNGFVMSLGIVIFFFLNPGYGFREQPDDFKTNETLEILWASPLVLANNQLQTDAPILEQENQPPKKNNASRISNQDIVVKQVSEVVKNLTALLQKNHFGLNSNYYSSSKFGGSNGKFGLGQNGLGKIYSALGSFKNLIPYNILPWYRENKNDNQDTMESLMQKILVLLSDFQNFLLNLDCIPKEKSRRGTIRALKSAIRAIRRLRYLKKLLFEVDRPEPKYRKFLIPLPSNEEYVDEDNEEGDDTGAIDENNGDDKVEEENNDEGNEEDDVDEDKDYIQTDKSKLEDI